MAFDDYVYYRGEKDEHGRTPGTPGYETPVSDRERDVGSAQGDLDADELLEALTLSPEGDPEARGIVFFHNTLSAGTTRPADGTSIITTQANEIKSNIASLNASMTVDEIGTTSDFTDYWLAPAFDADAGHARSPLSDLNRELEIWVAVSNWPLHMRSSTSETTTGDYSPRVDGSVYGAPGTFLDAESTWMHMSAEQYKTWDRIEQAYENPTGNCWSCEGVVVSTHPSGGPYPLAGEGNMAYVYAQNEDFQKSTVKCYSELIRVGQTWCLNDVSATTDSMSGFSSDPSSWVTAFNSGVNLEGGLPPIRQYFFASHIFGAVRYNYWNSQGPGSRLSTATGFPDAYGSGWYSSGTARKECWRHKNSTAPWIIDPDREWLSLNDDTADDHRALEGWRDWADSTLSDDVYHFDYSYGNSTEYTGTRTDEDGRSPLRASLRNYFRWSSPDLTVDFFRTMMRTAMMHETMGVVGFSVEELRARAQIIDGIGDDEEPSADAYIQAYTEYLAPYDVEFGTSLTEDTIFMMEVLRGLGVDVSSVSDVELAGSHANTYESPATSAVEIYHFAQMAHYVSSLKDALEDPSPLPRSMKTKMQKSRPIRMSTLSSVAPPSGEITSTTSTTSTSGESGGY